ncbi:MAG: UDP-3-O-(3-hydroxymyristoyl)glucosamine N-acyltransferase [Hyphomicrobiaceae bacterium]
MEHPGFFERAGPYSVEALAQHVDAEPVAAADASGRMISDVKPLHEALGEHVTFIENRKYLPALAESRAGFCFVSPALVARVPATTVPLVVRAPYRAFALALQLFYPTAMLSKTAEFGADDTPLLIHPTAQIEEGARIEAGAVIGREARIGRGSKIAAGAVIGYRVHVGRDSYIGPGASLTHALVGDRVVIHAGVRIGQDGFGFAMSAQGHLKVPQIGRVIIQDSVEIGANSTIDRGALKDTIIGEGTKIDNLVQIGHNVVIGRHCVIVSQVGLSGSCELGDFVVIGGQAGVVGHVKVGAGTQIAGASHVKDDVPPGSRLGGTPAVPFKEWARSLAAIRELGRGGPARREDDKETG